MTYMNWLTLQKYERVIKEYKPNKTAYVVLPTLFIVLLFGILSTLFGLQLLIAGGLALVLTLIVRLIKYHKEYYIITNKRLIQKTGFIGYDVKSVSFDRLADVMVTHTFIENIFKVGSIYVQTLAGGQQTNNYYGAEIRYLYLDSPDDAQKVVYDLMSDFKSTRKDII